MTVLQILNNPPTIFGIIGMIAYVLAIILMLWVISRGSSFKSVVANNGVEP
jgi:hypothetical protein